MNGDAIKKRPHVERSDITELHFIAPIRSIPSILKHGILCNKKAKSFEAVSVADPDVQKIREKKTLPNGRLLHAYANLYICARNPMLFKRTNLHAEICVLRIRDCVLERLGVVIADGNAASKYTAFLSSPQGLSVISKELVFAEFWTSPDQIVAWRRARAKCAEVLVPDHVEPALILGAYVSCQQSGDQLKNVGFTLPVTVDPNFFFRS